jgi:hypothetical protein
MRNAIVEKLRKHLAGSMGTECEVVYLLCEIRKLFDKQPPDPSQFALRLYCNWALHVDLSHPRTAAPFLERVDAYVFNKLDTGDTEETLLAERAMFREFVYLETFRRELSQFMAACDLPTALCDRDQGWYTFLAAYAGVIEDGSLTCVGKGLDRLRIIERVTFTKTAVEPAAGHVPFGIRWDILLGDKRRVEVDVGTLADDKLMRWGLRLINV